MVLIYAFILAYLIISIHSVIFAFRKLSKPGISKEVQKRVLKRHIISIIGFIISQLYVFVSLVFLVLPHSALPDKNTPGAKVIGFLKILFEA